MSCGAVLVMSANRAVVQMMWHYLIMQGHFGDAATFSDAAWGGDRIRCIIWHCLVMRCHLRGGAVDDTVPLICSAIS